MKKLFVPMILLASALVTTPVFAAVTVIDNSSFIEALSDADAPSSAPVSDFDSTGFPDTTLPVDVSGFASSSAMIAPTADTSADAYMSLFIDDFFSPLSVEMDMSAMAVADVMPPLGSSASSMAASVVDVTFTTDDFYSFFFGAEFMAASGTGSAEVLVTDVLTGDILIDILVIDAFESPFAEVALVAPGEYNLLVSLVADAALTTPGMIGGDASGLMFFEVAPAVVPVPAALPLMAAGLGLLGFVSRRRRG